MSNRLYDYTENYLDIKGKNIWAYPCFNAMAALTFTLTKKNYDKENFNAVKREFQDQLGWKAKFNASTDDLLFALLSVQNEKGPGLMGILAERSKAIKRNLKFPTTQLYYCLYLLSHLDESESEQVLRLALETYGQVKRQHPILSNPNDLPLHVSLLLKLRNVPEAVSKIEMVFATLQTKGFSKSNGLLAASVGLSELPYSPSEIGERAARILQGIKSVKLPASPDIYGVLSILMQDDQLTELTFGKLKETYEEIKKTESIRWLGKQEKMFIAVSLNMMDSNQQVNSSINISNRYAIIEKYQFVYYYKTVQMTNAAAAT